ncbi:hypothetical protein BC830DRAFT_787919 [Chytriomyces sp. MP71]|nr:hypothetical protein BC830DRAFT_787919 [Chytriomyces sp. MP71]
MQQYLRTIIEEDMATRRQQVDPIGSCQQQHCGQCSSFDPFSSSQSRRGFCHLPVKPWFVVAEELEACGMDPFQSGFQVLFTVSLLSSFCSCINANATTKLCKGRTMPNLPNMPGYGGRMNYMNSFLANDLACGLGGHIQDNIHCGMTGYQRPFLGGGRLLSAMSQGHMHDLHLPIGCGIHSYQACGMDPYQSIGVQGRIMPFLQSMQRYGGHMSSPFHKSYLNSFLANDLACGLGGHIQDNIHCGMTGYQRPFLGGGHLMNAMRHMHNVHPIEKLNVTKELMEDRQRDEFQVCVP